jgi:hypothetical protein
MTATEICEKFLPVAAEQHVKQLRHAIGRSRT